MSKWSESTDVIHAMFGFKSKKDLSYSSASTIEYSSPLIIMFESIWFKKPPMKEVNEILLFRNKWLRIAVVVVFPCVPAIAIEYVFLIILDKNLDLLKIINSFLIKKLNIFWSFLMADE